MLIPDIRRIYNRPCRDGSLCNPSKVSTCIQVGVRPETTRTLETMLDPLAEIATSRARLTGISRIDVLDRNSCRLRLVFDEGLQLAPGPTMETRTHPLTGFDPVADAREVLHHDFAGTGLSDYRPTSFQANRIEHFANSDADLIDEDIVPILRTPHHIVGSMIDAIPVRYSIHHISHGTLGLRQQTRNSSLN